MCKSHDVIMQLGPWFGKGRQLNLCCFICSDEDGEACEAVKPKRMCNPIIQRTFQVRTVVVQVILL